MRKALGSVPVEQVINNYVPDAGPTASVALTAAFATTVAIFRQADCVTAAEAGKASDEEGGEEDQSEAWP